MLLDSCMYCVSQSKSNEMKSISNKIYFFFNDTATTEIYTYLHTLSLHDALPICLPPDRPRRARRLRPQPGQEVRKAGRLPGHRGRPGDRAQDRKSTRLNSSH